MDLEAVTTDGRRVFVNVYVEDPERLVLVAHDTQTGAWTLPSAPLKADEKPEAAAARVLLALCGVGAKSLIPLYEDDIGRNAYVIAVQAIVDGMPRRATERYDIGAMTPDEFIGKTQYPKFYTRLFAVATTRKLFCVVCMRWTGPTEEDWKREDQYTHAFDADEAKRNVMLGEDKFTRVRIVEAGPVVGFHVDGSDGTKVSV
jgi:ADP-ribose pyrophosphatase YjhB (NUDIX family)